MVFQLLTGTSFSWNSKPSSLYYREVFPSLATDTNSVSTLKGKCVVKHKSEIEEDLDDFLAQSNHFFYTKWYDPSKGTFLLKLLCVHFWNRKVYQRTANGKERKGFSFFPKAR